MYYDVVKFVCGTNSAVTGLLETVRGVQLITVGDFTSSRFPTAYAVLASQHTVLITTNTYT